MATTHGKQHRLHLPDALHLTAPDSPAALFEAPATPTAGTATRIVLAATRIVVGWTFLWAFVDKVWGLGYATPEGKGWIDGGSPTKGFLSAAKGPFEGIYHDLAGTTFANWAFMLGLLGIGIAMTLGIGMRIAGVSGTLLYVLMWSVMLPPENNPVLDEHILGALIVTTLALLGAGNYFGLGSWWRGTALVKKFPWLT